MISMTELLKIEHLVKYYGSRSSLTKALNDISLTVEKGEFTAIMGASGSGKTTLLNCISTIDRPTGGQIYIDGVCTSDLKRNALSDFRRDRLGFIFQEFNLLDTLTAFDNIALALQIQRCAPKEIAGRVKEMAGKLGISDVLGKYPYQMSDSRSSRMLLESMELLNREEEATILMVTHDAVSASYASRVVFLKDGKLFNELRSGAEDRRVFFERIMDVVSLMGGDLNDAVPSLS